MCDYPDPDEEYELMYSDEFELIREIEDKTGSNLIKKKSLPAKRSLDFSNHNANDIPDEKDDKKESEKKDDAISLTPSLQNMDDVLISSTNSSNKRTAEDLFGDIGDIDFDSIELPSKRQKTEEETDMDLINKILEGRRLKQMLLEPANRVNVDKKVSFDVKENISINIPRWSFVPITNANGDRLYIRLESEDAWDKSLDINTGQLSLRATYASVWEEAHKILENKEQERIKKEEEVSEAAPHGENESAMLWVEKYRPHSYLDLLSEEPVNRALLHWLHLWDKVVFKKEVKMKDPQQRNSFSKRAGQFQLTNKWKGKKESEPEIDEDGRPHHKVALLCGPPGVGKTTLAHLLARLAGYRPVELNASDERSAEAFRNALVSATSMRSVLDAEKRPNCLILDEIDGAPVQTVELLVKWCTTTLTEGNKKKSKSQPLRRPVIAICNDLYATSLRPLRAKPGRPSSVYLAPNIFDVAELERLRREAVPSSDENATAEDAAPQMVEQPANVDAAVKTPVVVDSNDDGTVAQELELEHMRSTLEEAIVETRSTPLENRPRLPRIALSKRNRAVVRALNPMLVTYLEASRDLCETDSILFGAALATCRIIGAKVSTAGRATGHSSAIPAWRRRIEERIAKARALIGRLICFRSGNNRPRIVRTVRMAFAGTNVSLSQPDITQKLTERIVDLKQRIAAWGKRIRRYTERSTRFNQNRLFQSDQKRLYESLERPMVSGTGPAPNQADTVAFWRGLWSEPVNHSEGPWTEVVATQCAGITPMDPVIITPDDVAEAVRRAPNWKSPGLDGVHHYWLKGFMVCQSVLARQFQEALNQKSLPSLFTTGITHLVHKDQGTTDPSKYRPITPVALIVTVGCVTVARLASRLVAVASCERLRVEPHVLSALAARACGDIRMALHVLSFLRSKSQLTIQDIENVAIGTKDTSKSMMQALQAIFTLEDGKSNDILRTIQAAGEYDRLIEGIFENYLTARVDSRLLIACETMSWLLFYDTVHSWTMRNQNYSLYGTLPLCIARCHRLLASRAQHKLKFPMQGQEMSRKKTELDSIVLSVWRGSSPNVVVNRNVLRLDLLPLLPYLLTPTLRSANIQLCSESERQTLRVCAGAMCDYGLQYIQQRTPEGLYAFVLEPDIHKVAFLGNEERVRPQPAIRQAIAREQQLEMIRRNEEMAGRVNPRKNNEASKSKREDNTGEINSADGKESRLPNHLQRLQPKAVEKSTPQVHKDFFGRIVPTAQAHRQDAIPDVISSSGVFYQYREGFNNAVRRNVRLRDLL
ncbi:unnamed protein product [Parnassius apollo]|uniref:(apollo) hypothetical protein n=1 Tax=Parnassius apollo TaxID=110799 RepID=A0A8S3XNQ7_PARAO|nr:unnamed protein product [Parnassius apollo]